MKQHSALGATCDFKNAVSVYVMDFESCKEKWIQPNKKLQCERFGHQSSLCVFATMRKDVTAEKK